MTEKAIKNLKLKEYNFESTGINFSNQATLIYFYIILLIPFISKFKDITIRMNLITYRRIFSGIFKIKNFPKYVPKIPAIITKKINKKQSINAKPNNPNKMHLRRC